MGGTLRMKKGRKENKQMERKNIVLFGQHDRNDLLLQMIAEYRLIDNLFTYQIVKIPGKGYMARKLDPQLKNVTYKEAIDKADKIIALEYLPADAGMLMRNKEIVFWQDILNAPGLTHATPVAVNLKYGEEWFPDVLKKLAEVSQAGYRFQLKTRDEDLKSILSVLRNEKRSDICIWLDPQKECEFDAALFENIVRESARKCMSDEEYQERMIVSYKQKWKRNIYEFEYQNQDSAELFFSCSRKYITLHGAQMKIYEALKFGDKEKLQKISRKDLENFTAMCSYEALKAEHFEKLLNSKTVNIENLNNVILSQLGSRRCNLKCKYCFSDHTCEKLAAMSPKDMLLLTDMLIGDRENVKIHVDNNLGGEPFLDFEAVKRRHNTMIAYQDTVGVDSSFGLLTNGTKLKKEYLPWLREHLPYLGFSLDGNEETHDNIRRDINGNPSYKRTCASMEMVKASGWPVETGVSCVISGYNTNILSLQRHMRDDLKVKNIVMKPVRAAHDAEFALNEKNFWKLKMGYTAFFTELGIAGMSGDLEPLFTMLQPLDYAGRFFIRVFLADRVVVKRCGAGEHIFSIADDGKVYPCDSFNGVEGKEIASLQEGIHNRHGFEVPYVTEEHFGCSDCWARYLCGGVCQYVQHLNGYMVNEVTKMECDLAKFLISSAVRFWKNARENWKEEDLQKVENHILEIGFGKMKNKDAFVYAPC